ncbi:MAG: Electron transfer flavoprotein-ubiquinone oxidoreductase [Syntrophorhabdaceae bacterium PtaU1.Bin034]|jgi:electron transfer flavoprotein-quinone oxidoreductase|nr:MAG: Electron transfer flavoprotein-ubiquinone oxidoreductase [Syntrophorhabdaceae bacterium PtaU1.Bin034]
MSSMEKIDAVIVGGGLAGLSAAYRLAVAGRQVILLERGDAPGSKNVTGGRIYVEPIRRFLPEIVNQAPFERRVVKEMLSVLDEKGSVLLEHGNEKWRHEPYMSFTVLRARLDNWFSEKVMEKGGFVIPRRKVDDLLWEDGRVAGVKAGGEEIPARIVIAADGALSFTAQKAGLASAQKPADYALAIKEVYKLDPKTIEDRFGLEEGEGAACLFVGAITKGLFGGGFLYTNKDSLSVGLVIGIDSLMQEGRGIESYRIMDDFTARPEIRRWIRGGEVKEYSAHIISEAGIGGVSKLCADNMLVAGDAAGFALNMGLTVRGMEFAVASGVVAGETADEALAKGDTSANFLSHYERKLKESFVLRDMETFRHSREVLENRRLFTVYPKFICELMESLFTINDGPKAPLFKTAKDVARKHVLNWEGFKDFLSLRKM